MLHLHAGNGFNTFFCAVFWNARCNQIRHYAAVNVAAVLYVGGFCCCFVGDAFLFCQSSLFSLLRPEAFRFNSFQFFPICTFSSLKAFTFGSLCRCLCVGFSLCRCFEFCPALFFSLSARAFFCFAFDLRFSFPLCSLGLLNAQALKLFRFRLALLCCFQSYF